MHDDDEFSVFRGKYSIKKIWSEYSLQKKITRIFTDHLYFFCFSVHRNFYSRVSYTSLPLLWTCCPCSICLYIFYAHMYIIQTAAFYKNTRIIKCVGTGDIQYSYTSWTQAGQAVRCNNGLKGTRHQYW